MDKLVFILCALTSLSCAGLLIRAYMHNKMRLLLWCSLCFVSFAINNILLFVDLVVFPNVEFPGIQILRGGVVLVGVSALVYGLIWDGM